MLRTALFLATFALANCTSTPEYENAWPKAEHAKALVDLGMSYLQRGQFEVARANFDKAIAVDKTSSRAFHGLGLVEAQALNLSLAQNYLARAVKLDAKSTDAMADYAIILCKISSPTEGLAVLNNAQANLTEPHVGMQLAFGRCFEANHQLEKAEHAYADVLIASPNVRQALLSMAHLKYSTQQYLPARAFVQRYFSTNTLSSNALLLAAQIEDKLNNTAERNKYINELRLRYPKSKQTTLAKEQF